MTGAHILVIDDEPAILRAVKRPLELHGYCVATLASGAAAVAELQRFRPDVVVLDLVLPDMDGMAVCRAIRAESAVPIIVLSALADDGQKVQALDHVADDYLVKPFSMDELEARIRVALRHTANQHLSTVLEAGARCRLPPGLTANGAAVPGFWLPGWPCASHSWRQTHPLERPRSPAMSH